MTDPLIRELDDIRDRITKTPGLNLAEEILKLTYCVKALAVIQLLHPSN